MKRPDRRQSDYSVEADPGSAEVKPPRGGRNPIGAGTSETRRMLIGRQPFNETA